MRHRVAGNDAIWLQDTATNPMVTADTELTKAHGAVMATSPASKPLADMEMSGLP